MQVDNTELPEANKTYPQGLANTFLREVLVSHSTEKIKVTDFDILKGKKKKCQCTVNLRGMNKMPPNLFRFNTLTPKTW